MNALLLATCLLPLCSLQAGPTTYRPDLTQIRDGVQRRDRFCSVRLQADHRAPRANHARRGWRARMSDCVRTSPAEAGQYSRCPCRAAPLSESMAAGPRHLDVEVEVVRMRKQGDPLWNGVVIGVGVGAAGGYAWGRDMCGDDEECSIRAIPVGILGGALIGGAVGAIADALHK
jgi:hypothetical protein